MTSYEQLDSDEEEEDSMELMMEGQAQIILSKVYRLIVLSPPEALQAGAVSSISKLMAIFSIPLPEPLRSVVWNETVQTPDICASMTDVDLVETNLDQMPLTEPTAHVLEVNKRGETVIDFTRLQSQDVTLSQDELIPYVPDFDDEYTVTDDEIERNRIDHTPPPSDIDDSRDHTSSKFDGQDGDTQTESQELCEDLSRAENGDKVSSDEQSSDDNETSDSDTDDSDNDESDVEVKDVDSHEDKGDMMKKMIASIDDDVDYPDSAFDIETEDYPEIDDDDDYPDHAFDIETDDHGESADSSDKAGREKDIYSDISDDEGAASDIEEQEISDDKVMTDKPPVPVEVTTQSDEESLRSDDACCPENTGGTLNSFQAALDNHNQSEDSDTESSSDSDESDEGNEVEYLPHYEPNNQVHADNGLESAKDSVQSVQVMYNIPFSKYNRPDGAASEEKVTEARDDPRTGASEKSPRLSDGNPSVSAKIQLNLPPSAQTVIPPSSQGFDYEEQDSYSECSSGDISVPGSPLTPPGGPDKEAVVTRDTLRSRRLNIEATFIAGGVPPAYRVDEVMVNREGTYNKSVKERTVQCPICPRKLLDEAALIKHIRRIHKKEQRVMCKYCDYTSYDATETLYHTRDKHTFDHPNRCEHCNTGFNRKSLFIIHKKKFAGGECRMKYRGRRSVSEPQVSPASSGLSILTDCSGYGRYKCRFCNHGARNTNNIYRHVQEAHPEIQVDSENYTVIAQQKVTEVIPVTGELPGTSKRLEPKASTSQVTVVSKSSASTSSSPSSGDGTSNTDPMSAAASGSEYSHEELESDVEILTVNVKAYKMPVIDLCDDEEEIAPSSEISEKATKKKRKGGKMLSGLSKKGKHKMRKGGDEHSSPASLPVFPCHKSGCTAMFSDVISRSEHFDSQHNNVTIGTPPLCKKSNRLRQCEEGQNFIEKTHIDRSVRKPAHTGKDINLLPTVSAELPKPRPATTQNRSHSDDVRPMRVPTKTVKRRRHVSDGTPKKVEKQKQPSAWNSQQLISCDKQSWRQPSSSLACSADPRLKPRKGRRKRKPPTESMEDQELRRPGKVEFPTWSVGIDTRAYTSTSLLRFSNTSEPEWHNGRKDMVIIPLENESEFDLERQDTLKNHDTATVNDHQSPDIGDLNESASVSDKCTGPAQADLEEEISTEKQPDFKVTIHASQEHKPVQCDGEVTASVVKSEDEDESKDGEADDKATHVREADDKATHVREAEDKAGQVREDDDEGYIEAEEEEEEEEEDSGDNDQFIREIGRVFAEEEDVKNKLAQTIPYNLAQELRIEDINFRFTDQTYAELASHGVQLGFNHRRAYTERQTPTGQSHPQSITHGKHNWQHQRYNKKKKKKKPIIHMAQLSQSQGQSFERGNRTGGPAQTVTGQEQLSRPLQRRPKHRLPLQTNNRQVAASSGLFGLAQQISAAREAPGAPHVPIHQRFGLQERLSANHPPAAKRTKYKRYHPYEPSGLDNFTHHTQYGEEDDSLYSRRNDRLCTRCNMRFTSKDEKIDHNFRIHGTRPSEFQNNHDIGFRDEPQRRGISGGRRSYHNPSFNQVQNAFSKKQWGR